MADFFTEADDQHQLAFVVVSENERPQQSLVRMFVIKGQPVLACVGTNGIADPVVDIRHEMAFLDVQHLVEGSRDVEPETVG